MLKRYLVSVNTEIVHQIDAESANEAMDIAEDKTSDGQFDSAINFLIGQGTNAVEVDDF